MLAVFVGGALSYLTTRLIEGKADKKRALDEAYGLLAALLKMTDDIAKIEQHVRQSLEETREEGRGAPEWTRILDLVGLDVTDIRFTPQQIALVSAIHDAPLLMDMMEMEAARRILLQRFTKMMTMREKLAELGGIVESEGLTVSFEFEGNGPWTPLFLNLHTISKDIALDAGRMKAHAQKTTEKIGPALKSFYKFERFYDLTITG